MPLNLCGASTEARGERDVEIPEISQGPNSIARERRKSPVAHMERYFVSNQKTRKEVLFNTSRR